MKAVGGLTKMRLLHAALLFSTTFSATASFDSPRVINPYTNASPSGSFICEVFPSDIHGRGDARYRVLQNGSVLWEGVKPFTFVQSAVTDEGVVGGFGYTCGENGFPEQEGKAAPGDFVVAMIDTIGRLRLHERFPREMSRFLHDLPHPLAQGVFLDGPGNRFVVRVRDPDLNRGRESWQVYEISTGTKLRTCELLAGDGERASPIRAVPIRGTSLVLVQYYRYVSPDMNARFALLDPSFREIWSVTWRRDYNVDGDEAAEDQLRNRIWAEGAILDASESNRFTLFSARKAEEVSFTIQRDPGDDRKWVVSEVERRKHIPTPAPAERPRPTPTTALTVLGTFSLEAVQSAQAAVFGNVVGFGFDGAGRIGLLREGSNEACSFALIDTNGLVVNQVDLPNPSAAGKERQVKFAWVAKDQWIATSSEFGPEGKTTAWWLNAPAGKLEVISGFVAPSVRQLVGTPDGGFVALCVRHYKYSMEDELVAFDPLGKVRWRVKEDYQNERALFSPEDITLTSGGELAVLDNIRDSVQYFDLQGAFIRTIDLKKAWGREPNYASEISPEKDGGILVYDFHGSPPVVRMSPEGKVLSQFSLKHQDGRAIDPTHGVRVSPAGRVWACDGASLIRVTDAGVADLVLGPAPGGATLGRIACLSVDQQGRLYAADERSGEVHVFDQGGSRLRVCTPLTSDFAEHLMMADIAINERGEVFLSGGNSFPEKPTYVHFGPDGKRLGTKRLGLDNITEHWYPLPANDRILVVGYQDAFIVNAEGKVERKIQRRPDGMWLEHPNAASVAPDGSFAIVSGGSLQRARTFINLYSADGDPVRTVVLPAECLDSCFAYTGKYLAACTESAICLFTPQGEPVLQFDHPLGKLKPYWWACYSTKNGRELWLVSKGLKKVFRLELP